MPDEFRNTGFCLTPSDKALMVLGLDLRSEDGWEDAIRSDPDGGVLIKAIKSLWKDISFIQSMNRHSALDSLTEIQDLIEESCDEELIGRWPDWLSGLSTAVTDAVDALEVLDGALDDLDLPKVGDEGLFEGLEMWPLPSPKVEEE